MKRDTVINVLLIIAGIVLAIALFGAGVLWKSGAARSPKSHFVGALRLSRCQYLGKLPDGRPTGSYPETGLGEINRDLREADLN